MIEVEWGRGWDSKWARQRRHGAKVTDVLVECLSFRSDLRHDGFDITGNIRAVLRDINEYGKLV